MYLPAEDSYLLAETASRYSGKKALEVGIGSGVVTEALSKNFEVVVGTDLHIKSIEYAKHRLSKHTLAICCNMSDPLRSTFDLIVSNPPYLPNFSADFGYDIATDGGPTSIEWSIRFLEASLSLLEYKGYILILLPSSCAISKLDIFLQSSRLKKKKVNQRNVFYEILQVFEIFKA